jgi:nitroreductase
LEVLEAIRRRHSVRRYLDKDVPQDALLRILEAARLAPSAANIQPWYFVIVRDRERKRRIAESGMFARFVTDAPLVVVGCGDRKASPRWYAIDVSIAMEHMVLEATELGLGTCWIGSFDETAVKEVLKIPDRFAVVALLALGYPREGIDLVGTLVHIARRRKRLWEIAGLDEYGRPLA